MLNGGYKRWSHEVSRTFKGSLKDSLKRVEREFQESLKVIQKGIYLQMV